MGLWTRGDIRGCSGVSETGTARTSSTGTVGISGTEGETGIGQGTVEMGEKVIVGGGVITKVGEVIGGTAEEGTGSALEPAANADRI